MFKILNLRYCILLLTVVVAVSCSRKYYLTSSGGERPLIKKGDVFDITCFEGSAIIDTAYYYREVSINPPYIDPPGYNYVRFLDNCRYMKNINWSQDPSSYKMLENIDAELIGKYTTDPVSREIVMKYFSANKWGITISNYGTVSRNGDTVQIKKQVIPHIKNASPHYLIKTNISVRNKLTGTW